MMSTWIISAPASSRVLDDSPVSVSPYPNDHQPPHGYAYSDNGVVIVDLLEDRGVAVSKRKDAIRNAKASTIRKVLVQADAHHNELMKLWEKFHANPYNR